MKIADFDVLIFDELDSTNNYAKKYIDNNKSENLCNTVILANYQTKGRGAFQNKWQSNKGLNLTFSIVICPKILAKDQFFISKIISLTLIDYLKEKKIEAKIKWPNDILVEKKKISGILIENSVMGNTLTNSIVGIGININQIDFSSEFNAISLKIIRNENFDNLKELQKILIISTNYLNLCKNKKFEIINELYFNNLFGKDDYQIYKKGETFFQAKIDSIDEFGRLILKDKKNNKLIFGFKEVELVIK